MALKKIGKDVVQLKRMYVREGYEGRGIARSIVEEIVQFAKKEGYKKMILKIYPTMKNARNFLKKNNFREFDGEDEELIYSVKKLV